MQRNQAGSHWGWRMAMAAVLHRAPPADGDADVPLTEEFSPPRGALP